MEPITAGMLTIKALDPSASLNLSEYTEKWYVSTRVSISDGALLTGVSVHAPTPLDAVAGLLKRLQAVDSNDLEHIIVVESGGRGGRSHWRWNGAAFASEPVEVFASTIRR